MDRNLLVKQSHETARSKGWWSGTPRSLGECVMLMISEIAEATEEVRNKRPAVYAISSDGSTLVEDAAEICAKNLKPEGEAVEFADCLIRIADFAGFAGTHDMNYLVNKELVAASDSPWVRKLDTDTQLEEQAAVCYSLAKAFHNDRRDDRDLAMASLASAWAKIELIFDKRGWNLDEVLELKMGFNQTRSYRHGNKAL